MAVSVAALGQYLEALADTQLVIERTAASNGSLSHGERHGSWFIGVSWSTGSGIQRSAEIALTNATALEDSRADAAFVSARASASTDAYWVSDMVYEQRRSVRRIDPIDLENWLRAAIELADSYTPAALTNAYALGRVRGVSPFTSDNL